MKPALGSSIVDREKKLMTRFKGRSCQIDQTEECYQLTLQLRDAAGLKGVIHMRNPKTHALE
jgi:hypothetical protein